MVARRASLRVTLLALVAAVVAGTLVGVVAPLAVGPAPARAAATYGAPSWWNGDCDTVNWTAKARAAGWTGEAAHRLGGIVLGIPVCGPRNLAGGPNIWWSRPGWGELEWQCVEFAQRFMIQVYGVSPYQANGVDVVNHYMSAQGGGLVKVTNGTSGVAPQPGDVMSFSSPTNSAGHVAVVATTTVDGAGNGSILLATQNDTVDGWRTLAVSNWRVASFGSLYPYAWLHDPLNRGNGGVSGDTTVREGSYVSYAGTTYRIAGGAPLVVTSWAAVGGTGTVIALDAARWATLRTVPRDGTFLHDATGTARWRIAGGAAFPVTDCTAAGMGGCADAVDIDPRAVTGANIGGVYGHLRTTVADGTFLRVGNDGAAGPGTIGRIAGRALVPVTDCDDLGGCNNWVNLESTTWSAYRAAHTTPVDGTVVRLQPSGRYATFATGRCTLSGGAPSAWTDIPDRAVTCGSTLGVAAPAAATLVRDRPAAVVLTASGGTGPYRWSVAAGAAPAGMTLGATGTVSGTPTTAASYAFTVRATDATGATADRAVTLAVAPALALVTTTVPSMRVGTAAGASLLASGGTGRYRWTAVDPLPAGLVLSADGLVAGTPTTAGTRTVRIRATDAGAPAYGVTGSFKVVVVAR